MKVFFGRDSRLKIIGYGFIVLSAAFFGGLFAQAQVYTPPAGPPPALNPGQLPTFDASNFVRNDIASEQTVLGSVITGVTTSWVVRGGYEGVATGLMSWSHGSGHTFDTTPARSGFYAYGDAVGLVGYASGSGSGGIGGRSENTINPSQHSFAGRFKGPVKISPSSPSAGDGSLYVNGLVKAPHIECTDGLNCDIPVDAPEWMTATASGANSYGVAGFGTANPGILLTITNPGANGAIYGDSVNSVGIVGQSVASGNSGIYAQAEGSGTPLYGVYGKSSNPFASVSGVYGVTKGGLGNAIPAQDVYDQPAGIRACYDTGAGPINRYGIRGESAKWAGWFQGPVGGLGCDDRWWDCDWDNRINIKLVNNSGEDLANFPVMVRFDNDDVDYTKMLPNGEDLRFVEFDATDGEWKVIPYQIERWKHGPNQESVIWVKPSMVKNFDGALTFRFDQMWMYYNNADAASGQSVVDVWNSAYVGVWHLNETPANGVAGHDDSSITNNAATPLNFAGVAGSTTGAEGINDGANHFDGVDDYMTINDDASLNLKDYFTFSAWVKMDKLGEGVIYSSGNFAFSWAVRILENVDGYRLAFTRPAGGTIAFYSTQNLSADTWYYLTVVKNGVEGIDLSFYVNGIPAGTADVDQSTPGIPGILPLPYGVKYISYPGESFDGVMDEIRLSNVARSAAWVKAEYESGLGNMVRYGGEESRADYVKGGKALLMNTTDRLQIGKYYVTSDTLSNLYNFVCVVGGGQDGTYQELCNR